MPLKIFVFSERFKVVGSPRIVAIGDLQTVASFLSKERLSREFGGWIVYRNDKIDQELLGVWGARKASKFRRLLRESGTDLEITEARPRNFRVKVSHAQNSSI